MTSKLRCRRSLVNETLEFLRAGGAKDCEAVVLWLGTDRGGVAEVLEVLRPEQIVEVDYFRIPEDAVRAIMKRIKQTHYQILAQVHSHPGRAFHSRADDAWAIIRHVGAVSIVIPHFARDTSVETFGEQSATFQLNADDHWIEAGFAEMVEII